MKLFVVGQFRKETEAGNVWDIQGVFDSEEEAVKNCINSSYFVGPVELNKPLPDKQIEWPGCYYPIREDYIIVDDEYVDASTVTVSSELYLTEEGKISTKSRQGDKMPVEKNIVEENRIGTFQITHDAIKDAPDEILEFFSNVIIIRAESLFHNRAIVYTAYSKLFDINHEAIVEPNYNIIVDREETEEGVSFTFTAEKQVG